LRVKGQKENNPRKIENLQKFSKYEKNQKITKLHSKKVLNHENRLKNALFTANNVILRFFLRKIIFFSKIHKTDKTKKYVSYDIE
jgi:hypothetical protein